MAGRPINVQTRLALAITRRGYSVMDVCRATGLSQMRLRHAMAGRRPLWSDELENVARFLNVTTDYLLGESNG